MQEILTYAIYDREAEMYDTPIFMLNEVNAKRWFFSQIQEGKGRFQFFADEMELHQVGSFNVINGKVSEMKKTIITGKQIGKEIKQHEKRNATSV